jgi:hypothetical protein
MKVTLREVFLLVLIVALALGWWIDRQKFSRQAPPTVSQVGRWQVVFGTDGREILVDTSTGELWTYSSSSFQWNYRPAPAKKMP